MYEDYMKNYYENQINRGFQNMYDQGFLGGKYEPNCINCGYKNTYEQNLNEYPYGENPYMYGFQRNGTRTDFSYENIENFYPEIYKLVYPMVKKVCLNNNGLVNRELYQKIVDEVYSNFESNDRIELNITLENDTKGEKENSEITEKRSPRSNIIKDLIGILVIRELLNKPNCPCRRQRPRNDATLWNKYTME